MNKIIINKETLFKSLMKDAISLSLLVLVSWFNYKFLNDGIMLKIFTILALIGYIASMIITEMKPIIWYYNVSDEKINKIKKILEEK
jgi:hypothetical protein